MHRIPLTPVEEAGLRAHGLDIGTPSQLSDAFRQGVAWGQKHSPAPTADADHAEDARDAAQPTPLFPDDDPMVVELAKDAARYRWLRDRMAFAVNDEDLPVTVMRLASPIPAPNHNFHTDWVADRFDASADEAIDAAMQISAGQGEWNGR